MNKTTKFNFRPEEGQNPYIGFMSFQHFNGEKLYSDSIVRPENNYTETEAFECYPVSQDVPENGREEGYYPDSSVAYIRTLWKEFEPVQGEYNYKFIEDILEKAKEHNQTVIFRLMAHATRAIEDVPEWLKKLIPCPERPDGARLKDSPTHPLFLELFCKAIEKLGERFDDDPTFDAIDISLPGAWGEGHNLHLYSPESLKNITDTYLKVFKKTQLMGQLSRPELIEYASQQTNIGWRGDGLGEPRHTAEIYPPNVNRLCENWKKAPVSFESYWWLGEWQRKGWEIDEIIEKTLSWHISSFNAKSLPIPWNWKEKVDFWVSKMGYHYAFNSFTYPEELKASETAEFELSVTNHGVAPIYRYIPLKIRLVGADTELEFDSNVDMRNWLPGDTIENISITLPQNIKTGKYDIEIGMYNEVVSAIYLCCDAERNGSFYKMGEVTVK